MFGTLKLIAIIRSRGKKSLIGINRTTNFADQNPLIALSLDVSPSRTK